jgi:DNA-binding NarL/FixJ family response regulator
VKILIVTMHQEKEYLYQALAAGADGYFLKKDAGPELFTAIEKVRKGLIYVSPHFSEKLEDAWVQIRRELVSPVLTTREIEVLKQIAAGKGNKEIGAILFISVHTVERHRANILKKLNFHNTAELVRYAIQNGYGCCLAVDGIIAFRACLVPMDPKFLPAPHSPSVEHRPEL